MDSGYDSIYVCHRKCRRMFEDDLRLYIVFVSFQVFVLGIHKDNNNTDNGSKTLVNVSKKEARMG